MKCRIGELEIEGTEAEICELVMRFTHARDIKSSSNFLDNSPSPQDVLTLGDWDQILGCKVERFISERVVSGTPNTDIASEMYSRARDMGVKTKGDVLVKGIYEIIQRINLPKHLSLRKDKESHPTNPAIDWVSILGISAQGYALRRLTEGATHDELQNELIRMAEQKVNLRRGILKQRIRLIVWSASKILEKKTPEAKLVENVQKPAGLGAILNSFFPES